jgi:primary-amine oxidase
MIRTISFMQKLRVLTLLISIPVLTLTFNRCSQPGKAETAETDSNDQVYDPRFAHPLDPLDSNEIKLVKEILVTKKFYTKDHNFSFIKLQEPAKSEVLAYQPGKPFGRKALASIYHIDSNVLTEIELDLKSKQVLDIDTMKGMQPVGLLGHKADSIIINKVMMENAEWVAALKKRGIPIDSVTHGGNYAADMGMAPKGHREEIVAARYKNKKTRNLAIMGLYAYVDLTDKKVLKIIDTGKGFTQPWEVNYFKEDSAIATTPQTKPIKIQQPEGVTYKVQGHEITWNNWKFRYGVSNREGLVIYQAQF